MGGIAGLYYPALAKPVDPARIAAMRDALSYRGFGPEIWAAPGVGLAGEFVSFSGTITNAAALRAELEAQGAPFATDAVGELLSYGWQVWGTGLLERLDGTFAFALYDSERRSLLLARDRLGVEHLVYTQLSDGAVAFASEIRGLLAHPLFRRTPDFRAVEDYLGLGYVPDDASLLAGVKKLAAGHFLLLERGKAVPQPVRWWDLDFSKRASGKRKDLEAELVAHMRAAVRAQMTADVPVGALLSGGLDDSAVVALMAEASKAAVKTYAGGPEGDAIAGRFATNHRTGVALADEFAAIDALAAAFDEPMGDPSALGRYRLYGLAGKGVGVALSGEGADEALAGHRRYRTFLRGERVRTLMPDKARAELFGRLGLPALAGSGEAAYARAVAVTPPELRDRLYTSAAKHTLAGHSAEQRYVEAMREAPARDALDRVQYADIRHRLPGEVLRQLTGISRAAGVEARVPLLDHRLVDFAATLPPALRIRGGQGKWLMRKALEPWLPKEMLYRREKATPPPVDAWFRGALAAEAAELAKSKLLASTGWFEMASIAALADQHKAGRADHGRTLWQLLMLERSLKRLF